MVKIRLRRTGAKKQPHYRVVVSDSRAPRDGKFIETIGHYNPRTEPPTVEIDVERAIYWLSVGAQPTAAVERMLDKLGILAQVTAVRRGEVSPEALASQLLAEQATAAEAEAEAEETEEAEEPVEAAEAEEASDEDVEAEEEGDEGPEEAEADEDEEAEAEEDDEEDEDAEAEEDDDTAEDAEDEDEDEGTEEAEEAEEADDPESDEADDINEE
ncbi:MAG: 30S ribosomal protein S16 [Anaerolineae bacterium]|jgi:small subunit ribosomal protein S16